MTRINILTLSIFLSTLSYISGFLPDNFPGALNTDFTQRDVVSIAIKNVLSENKFLPDIQDILGDAELMENLRNLEELVKLSENETTSLQRTIEDLTDFTAVAGLEHSKDAVWTFSNEQIQEGHTLIYHLRQQLIELLTKEPTDLRLCRRTLGQIFHLILSFYSNTNWAESHAHSLCNELGIQEDFPYQIAELDVPTCKPCSEINEERCRENLLVTDTLTSGYWNGAFRYSTTDKDLDLQDLIQPQSKCRYGGSTDVTHAPYTVNGGINKMSGNPKLSPHYFLHERAAIQAVYHCSQFLLALGTGLAGIVGKMKIQQLMGVSTYTVYAYIDSQNAANEIEILAGMMEYYPTIKLLKDITLDQACRFSEQSILALIRIENLINDTLPEECHPENIYMYHIIPELKQEKRAKRALTTPVGMNLYNIIAQVSGGSVYVTSKTDIGAVVDLIKETVSSKPPVSIMKFVLKSADRDTFTIPVDDLMDNVTIKIQATTSTLPVFNLHRPDGTMETYRDHAKATKQTLGRRLVVVKLINPSSGRWNFTRTSRTEYEVEISAKTDLDFSYKFLQPGPGGYGEYPLVGRPIAGANTSVQVSVPLYDQVNSVDRIVVLDDSGSTVTSETLHNIGGRRGKSLFKTYIIIPAKEFKLAIEGKDKSNNLFRRLDPRLISTLAIKLEVLKVSGSLYVKSSVTLSYRVTNVGGGITKVVVKISDDKGFSQTPATHRHTLASHQNITGSFTIKAGTIKGETVTVTVSANAEGAPANKVQYSVQRLTVEENITRAVDTTPPMCNVTKTVGKCDIGMDVCRCVNQTWSMEAAIGDVGFGLQSVFASGAGNQSMFSVDPFSGGHTIDKGVLKAKLKADCCHQKATITVVDLAGNVGLCNITLTPNFVPPDPKLCENPTKFNSNATSSTQNIPCKTTNISGPCDFSNVTCTGASCSHDSLCKNMTWQMWAKIGNHSNTIHQVVPVNVGPSAQFKRINDSLELKLDCCHTTAYINVIDIAGNIGRCQGNALVIMKTTPIPTTTTPSTTLASNITSSSSSPSSLPMPIIAGAAGGGVVLITAAVVIGLLIKKHTANKVDSQK